MEEKKEEEKKEKEKEMEKEKVLRQKDRARGDFSERVYMFF